MSNLSSIGTKSQCFDLLIDCGTIFKKIFSCTRTKCRNDELKTVNEELMQLKLKQGTSAGGVPTGTFLYRHALFGNNPLSLFLSILPSISCAQTHE